MEKTPQLSIKQTIMVLPTVEQIDKYAVYLKIKTEKKTGRKWKNRCQQQLKI